MGKSARVAGGKMDQTGDVQAGPESPREEAPRGGDRDAQSAFLIRSHEVASPFPQHVGGDRVDDYIKSQLERLNGGTVKTDLSEIESEQPTLDP